MKKKKNAKPTIIVLSTFENYVFCLKFSFHPIVLPRVFSAHHLEKKSLYPFFILFVFFTRFQIQDPEKLSMAYLKKGRWLLDSPFGIFARHRTRILLLLLLLLQE